MKNKFIKLFSISLFLFSCNNVNNGYDATGTFEATETIVSAEANGKILALNLEEGDVLNKVNKWVTLIACNCIYQKCN